MGAMAIRSTAFLCALLFGAFAPACGGDDDVAVSDFDAAPDPRCPSGADPIAFMCPCDLADDNCDIAGGDYCFMFNEKGPHCTHACEGAEDCPEPSNECNGMGVCKAPD